MDQTDRQIVELLRQDGRRPNVDIARLLGISEGTVRKRVERLIANGVLRVTGLVNPKDAGFPWLAFIMLEVALPQLEEVASSLAAMPEVRSVAIVTGEHDVFLEAAFSDEAHLMSFLSDRVARIPGVQSSNTTHVLRSVKQPSDWQVPDIRSPRVLIVDDDPDFVESARLILEPEGYEIRTASTGREALTMVTTQSPDLVILDIMMEGILDGWDASGRIRSDPRLRHTPILVVSSIATSEYAAMFPTDDDNLIDNFLSKPVAPDKLRSEVKRLLARR